MSVDQENIAPAETPAQTERLTTAQRIVNKLMERLDAGEVPPWVKPYSMGYAFNRYTMKTYSGFNRIIIPLFGASEVMTFNQLIKFNKEKGYSAPVLDDQGQPVLGEDGKPVRNPLEYRVRKGSSQIPLCFYNVTNPSVSRAKFQEVFPGAPMKPGVYRSKKGVFTIHPDGKITRKSVVLKGFGVFSIDDLIREDGSSLPHLTADDGVVITLQEPKEVFDRYIENSGINLQHDNSATPHYLPGTDTMSLNMTGNEEHFWASTFHECAHSTGHSSRLNRGIVPRMESFGEAISTAERAKEELVADIASGMICQEVGIDVMVAHNGVSILENTAAYVKSWGQYVKDDPNMFITACSQAEKAFNYVTSVADESEDNPDD